MLSMLVSKCRYYRSRVRFHIPDSMYLKLTYQERTGKKLNLRRPVTFCDKIQWLKLNYRHKNLIMLVDKFLVQDHVAQRIGKQYLIPNFQVYDSADEIDPASLPNAFVLKPNHGCGWVICCNDKQTIDWSQTRQKLTKWMSEDYSIMGKEWPYAHVPRKIICQALLKNEGDQPLVDYRFFCTNGKARFCQVDSGWLSNPKRYFYDLNWNKMPIQQRLPTCQESLPRPICLDEMIDVATKLSQDLPFARIDLYNVGTKVYFGEITLFPGAGYIQYEPEAFNSQLGQWITLPKPCRKLA